jgi:NodT family efflux transporter outer membrane factor (OMF) lipoprotein
MTLKGKTAMRTTRSKRNRYGHVGAQPRSPVSILLVTLILQVSSGCTAVGPDYVRVEPDAPEKWHTEPAGGLVTSRPSPESLARWWNTLEDPELSSLEDRAVKGNLDLKDARARVREARALWGINRASLFPALNALGSVTDHRSSENSGTKDQSTLYAAGFDAGWELDIFGGVRRSVEAAQASLEATQEDLHDVLVSLLAEVALNYVDVRTYQARLAAAEANIKAQEGIYELNLSRYQAGLIDGLAVKQASYNLERSRSQIPTLQTELEAAKNRLAVLLGEKPGSLHQELSEDRPIPVPPVAVAVGVPAENLRHRPDIRRAERNLAAQTARIGVATADLYPKLRLSGTIGLESVASGDLLQWASRTWTVGPSASWNIFDAGAIRQNIQVQTARQEQALIQYESAVLSALEEVENVLMAYAKEQRRRESLAAATASAERADLLARDQYEAGLVDFSNVLDAQRSLLALQDELAQSDGAAASNLIRLYKALGGGWATVKPAMDESNHATD